jgi:predicted Zn-dependent protease
MRKKEKLLEVADRVITSSDCDETEVIIFSADSALTRYSKSFIHQNVAETDVSLILRVSQDKRYGIANTNILSDEGIEEALKIAKNIALSQDENPDYIKIAEPEKVEEVDAWADDTEKQTPQERAEAVINVIGVADKEDFESAGSYSITSGEVIYANSNGIRLYQPRTNANLIAVILSDTSEGYAEAGGTSVSEVNSKEVAVESTNKCLKSQNPIQIEPGEYDVILEPYAINELVSWLSYVGFNAKLYNEKRSFLSGRMGEKIWSESITFIDDGLNPDGFPFPFDFEGVPRQRVVLVENGVAKNMVYDRKTAKKENTKSTGHALPPGSNAGAMPLHPLFVPGNETTEDLLNKVEKGLWISSFHYVNGFIDTKNAVFTGMTRYGTFLIEDGEITKPVKNMRFTESMLKAFSNVDGITEDVKKLPGYLGGGIFPTILIRDFRFTGTTEH